ncbi:DUF342 domain-containing protein [Desulforhopalus sp. IMCC35007]|uniref:DUF342 domain-containing protein n=1 Tax=Desulforhopalus sp. IMCC35007 TaxID=2569543 RepID=UPI0010AEC566|nr:FapA family protein [Desulforhopalus sp. IMCC35007]TKB10330.1 DUF342 domain-containing protein [Desulforhopalus sp. IMCC35007]
MIENQPDKQKFLKPHIHFKSSFMKIGEDYTTDKIAVTELVKAQTLLASFENYEFYMKQGYDKAPLEPGENTDFGEDGISIIATTAGYPKIIKMRLKGIAEMVSVISVEPLVSVSAGGMKAIMSIHPPIKDVPPPTEAMVHEILAELGISYGVNEDALAKIFAIFKDGEVEFNKVTFAKGKAVGKSVDSYLRFDMEIGPIAGTLLDNGSIDFRDRRIMVGVNAGQCIATKIPAVLGEPGINIFGQETAARTPIDIKVQPLNDAKFNPETGQVIATKDGVLSIVNNNVIKVLSHQVITGDVDYTTGNVDSKNCVTINGSVQPGFKVNTTGDLKIGGSVMSTTITGEANLVISGGITGKNSHIEAAGDCDIHFIEQGTLHCGGLCVIRKQSYYSEIEAASDIRCKPGSKIIGGSLVAGGSITLFDVGADTSNPSVIAAGVVASRLKHFTELKQSIVEQEEEIISWLQRYKGTSNSKKVKQMEQKLADTKLARIRLNLIPGTGIYSRAAGPDDLIDPDTDDYKAEGGIPIEEITIDVHGAIYRDTEVRIGNRSLKLEKTVTNRQFKLHPTGKRIIATPLKKS